MCHPGYFLIFFFFLLQNVISTINNLSLAKNRLGNSSGSHDIAISVQLTFSLNLFVKIGYFLIWICPRTKHITKWWQINFATIFMSWRNMSWCQYDSWNLKLSYWESDSWTPTHLLKLNFSLMVVLLRTPTHLLKLNISLMVVLLSKSTI